MTEYVRITDRKIELTDEGVEALVTDYTPTTEEVRALIQGASAEEFDRWLAEVKAEAWEEGYAQGDADAHTENRLDSQNPYLKEMK